MAALITQADIELHYKPRQVRDAACDDGSGVAGPALPRAIAAASRIAEMILAKGGWTAAEIALLVAGDEAINGAICDIAWYELTKRNAAWLDQMGKPVARTAKDDAVQLLEDIAAARKRPTSEATAGTNARFRNRMNVPEPQYWFAGSRSKPRPGGY